MNTWGPDSHSLSHHQDHHTTYLCLYYSPCSAAAYWGRRCCVRTVMCHFRLTKGSVDPLILMMWQQRHDNCVVSLPSVWWTERWELRLYEYGPASLSNKHTQSSKWLKKIPHSIYITERRKGREEKRSDLWSWLLWDWTPRFPFSQFVVSFLRASAGFLTVTKC